MVTLLFFDCEFTDLSGSVSLISAGFVTQSGDHFYAELSEYEEGACNEFVKATVLPLLSLPPIATIDFISSLTDWLGNLGGELLLSLAASPFHQELTYSFRFQSKLAASSPNFSL